MLECIHVAIKIYTGGRKLKDFLTNKVLMVRPIAFTYNEETAKDNLYQKNDHKDGKELQDKAVVEFDSLVEKLRAASIEVLIIQDTKEPHTPDSIFPNNWFSTHKDGILVLYPMYAENRRLERTPKILDFVKDREALKIIDLTENEKKGRILEGTGSMCLDRKNKIAYASLSKRTNKELFEEFCKMMNYKPISFSGKQTINGEQSPIYHTNVLMTIGEEYVLIFLDSIVDEKEKEIVRKSILDSGKELIEITEEQTNHFLGNALELRKKDGSKVLVMSKSANDILRDDQRKIIEKSAEIVYSDIPTIERYGGGSVRCMIAEFFL